MRVMKMMTKWRIKPMEKSKFTAPVEKLGQELQEYGDAKLNTLKLQTAKGMAQCASAFTSYFLLFIIGSALLLILSMGLILLLGEVIGSYAYAAFIVAGALLLILLILLLFRKYLFRSSFISTFVGVFAQAEDSKTAEKIRTKEQLDAAIMRSQVQEYKQEAQITKQVYRVKEYYSPDKLVKKLASRIFGKK